MKNYSYNIFYLDIFYFPYTDIAAAKELAENYFQVNIDSPGKPVKQPVEFVAGLVKPETSLFDYPEAYANVYNTYKSQTLYYIRDTGRDLKLVFFRVIRKIAP